MNKRIDSVIRHMRMNVKVWVLVLAVLGGMVFGGAVHSLFSTGGQGLADAGPEVWTCSMHPQIQLPKPGLCPICGMDLIPLDTDQAEAGSLRELTVSDAARKLMAIRTSPVERRFVEAQVRMVGKIDYDETLLKYITAWVPGRVDRLHVHYAGVPVNAGEHMVDLYSPDLLGAQAELLQSVSAVRELEDSDIGIVREMTEATARAAREKLRLWGLTGEQIAEIERRGEPTDHVTIHAPIGGIVIHANAQEGMYVQTGTKLYTIADLSQVWAKLDAYESDLQWLRPGQEVELTSEAYPGEVFVGTISLIDPMLTESTRTVKLRVSVPNAEMKLKPGMFVRAIVRARVAVGGKVMDEALVGKWICSMHPEVVRAAAGDCDVCGMPLVRTESLGYVGVSPDSADAPLIIPATAALITGGRSAGSRAIVYVQVDSSLLTLSGVIDWSSLLKTVQAFTGTVGPGAGPLARLWGLLSSDLRADLLAASPDDMPPAQLQHRFVDEINDVLVGNALYRVGDWQGMPLGGEAAGLISRGPAGLASDDLTRLNRLLLEAIFPNAIMSARSGPTYQGREILLGPRAGDYYIVRGGLTEGERVVTNGSFKIDAELQIRAQPAMMTPEGGGSSGHQHGAESGEPGQMAGMAMSVQVPAAVKDQLRAVLAAADDVERAMRTGSLENAALAFHDLYEKVQAVPQDALTGQAELLWREYEMLLANDGVEGEAAETFQQAMNVAELVGEHAASMASKMGISLSQPTAMAAAIGPEFRKQFDDVLAGYMLLQQALAGDDLPTAASAAEQTLQAVGAVDMALLTGLAHTTWMDTASELTQILTDIAAADDIQRAREGFSLLSEQLAATITTLGGAPGDALYQLRCPMAFDGRGAIWLQSDEQTRNPYFGAVMPECGSVTDIFPAAREDGDSDE